MKDLQLQLINQWFEMTKSGVKTEDYREITPYFCNRFLMYEDNLKTVKWWGFMQNVEGLFFRRAIEINIDLKKITFKNFGANTMTLGYPKSTDSERILKYEHKGIEIRTGNPDWGAIPGKYYFVIKHGSILT